MTKRRTAEGIVTAHMERQTSDGSRRPSIVVKLVDDWHGAHCICGVPPGMTPPNGTRVRVVVPSDTTQETWFLAPREAA